MIGAMCRNIKTLFNFAPPATDAEIHAASDQFVRKLSGFTNRQRPIRRCLTAQWMTLRLWPAS